MRLILFLSAMLASLAGLAGAGHAQLPASVERSLGSAEAGVPVRGAAVAKAHRGLLPATPRRAEAGTTAAIPSSPAAIDLPDGVLRRRE